MEPGVGKTRAARICRTRYRRRESCTEKELWRFAESPLTLQLNTDQHMYMRLGKGPPKRNRYHHTGLEIVPVPSSQSGKSHNSQYQSSQKGLASVVVPN